MPTKNSSQHLLATESVYISISKVADTTLQFQGDGTYKFSIKGLF